MIQKNILKSLKLITLIFILVLTVFGKNNKQIVVKEPYLIFTGNNTETKICFQLDSTRLSILKYGKHKKWLSKKVIVSNKDDFNLYSIVLKDLKPGTKYFYEVIIKDNKYRSSFVTAPKDSETKIKFMVYGDHRTYPQNHDSLAASMVQEFKKDAFFQSFIISSGDIVGKGKKESHWQREFFDPNLKNIRHLYSHIPLLPVEGNHNYGQKGLLRKYFPYPFHAGEYWSFDYGPAHIFMFDLYLENDEAMEKELEYFEQDMKNTNKKWKILALHEPGWTAGGHSNSKFVQEKIQPICEKYNINLVLAGHNHYYARASVNRVQHITTGGGGAPLYDFKKDQPNIVKAAKTLHYCKVEIENDRLSFTVVTPTGEIIDKFIMNSIGEMQDK